MSITGYVSSSPTEPGTVAAISACNTTNSYRSLAAAFCHDSIWKAVFREHQAEGLTSRGGRSSPLTLFYEALPFGIALTSRPAAPPVASNRAELAPLLPDFAEMLVQIRTRLGLNMSQLANVLRVQRPTVYAWLNAAQKPNPANIERVRKVWQIAAFWGDLSSAPLKGALHREVVEGHTVLSLLSEEHLRSFLLNHWLKDLIKNMGVPTKKRRRGFEMAQRRGLGELHDAEEALARETGQRVAPEE
jgi:transcriptional regulator with XRE-family HTH domain